MTEGKIGVRLRLLAAFVVFLFAALGVRLWFVQVLNTAQAKVAVRNNSIRFVPVPPPRGRILDRQGNLLAGNRLTLAVTVNRQQVGSQEEAVLFRLARLLKIRVKELTSRLNDPRYLPYAPVPVAFGVSKRVAFYIGEHPELFRGVDTEELTLRTYPQGSLAAHVLGYTGQISADQMKDPRFAHYSQDAIVGKAGVEATYERYLQGKPGEVKVQVDAAGKTLGTIGREPPQSGDDIVLSINDKIQRLADESLVLGMQSAHAGGYPAFAGAVVVMNPNNGQVLALASRPTFDPRFFDKAFTAKQYFKTFLAEKRHEPLFDRALQAAYPPGSTFKPFIALAAMHERIASPYGYYPCPATFTVPGTNPPEVKNNWTTANFGDLSLSESLVISCDTVFYQFGWDFWRRYVIANGGIKQKAPGVGDVLQRDLRAFGFGRATGVDVSAEATGVVPDPAWKRENRPAVKGDYCSQGWCPGDDLNMSIGQGDVGVTPLQLATAYSAIANGGIVWQPHVGLRVQRGKGHIVTRIKPRKLGRLPFTKKQIAYIREALTGVVSNPGGTAYSAFVGFPFSKVPVAGKTGTAEIPGRQPYSWFAAMAPVQHPRFVVVSLVEQGGHGADTSAPIVRRILEGLFGQKLTGTIHTSTQKD
jgi:penicillin-binding protein 2